MKEIQRTVALLAAALIVISGPAAAKEPQELPQVTEDGLHLVPDSKLAIVYAEPGASLADYQRVQVLDAYVAFRKNWERDQRSSSAQPLQVTSRDVENIKNKLAQEFHEVFKEVLEDGGYPVVDEAGADVLLIRPAIINLDVNAPDTPRAGRTRSYVSSAGEMTLYVELYDSVTGDQIAKALDRKADRSMDAHYTWANSVSNRAAARRILEGWAKILVDALNEAKERTTGAGNGAENGS